MTIYEFCKMINPSATPIVVTDYTVSTINENGEPCIVRAVDSEEFTYKHGSEVCWITARQYAYTIETNMV